MSFINCCPPGVDPSTALCSCADWNTTIALFLVGVIIGGLILLFYRSFKK